MGASASQAPLPSRLLFVADAAHAPEGLPALVQRAVAAGVRWIELRRSRDRQPEAGGPLPSAAWLKEICECLAVAGPASVLVNDRVDLAILAGAAGAHVGQEDMPPAAAREVLGEGRLLGLSTHDASQLAAGERQPVDYLALGPVTLSVTKSGHAAPLGVEAACALARRSALPIVMIGGITPSVASALLQGGASAVAVASSLSVGDLEANAEALLRAVGE